MGTFAWRASVFAFVGALVSSPAWAQATEQVLSVEASFPSTGVVAAGGLDLVSFSAFIPGRGGALAIAEVTPAATAATLRLPADVPLLLRAFKPAAWVPGPVFCIGEATLVLRTGYRYTFSFYFDHDAGNPALSRCAGAVRIRDPGGKDLPPGRVDTAITGIPGP